MAILGQFTVPGCTCCNGATPTLNFGPCESLSGAADLCGVSGFSSDLDPYVAGDPWAWEGQLRKWRRIEQSGSIRHTIYAGEGSQCDKPVVDERDATYTGVALEGSCTVDTSTLTSSGDFPFLTSRVNDQFVDPGIFTKGFTLTTCIIEGTTECVDLPPLDDVWDRGTGIAEEELLEEHYFYDALQAKLDEFGAESGVESGSSCCTELTDANLTTPKSVDPISMEGTAVRRWLYVAGCDLGEDYLVNITLSQGTGEDYEEFVVQVLIPCNELTYFYLPLPRPGEDPICWVGAVLAP